MRTAPLLLLAAFPLLSGCLARAALDMATAPVRMAGKAVDLATTSQSEADEKRGRDLRRREEQLGRLEREYRALARDCADDDDRACAARDAVRAEMDDLRRTIPYEAE